MVLCLPENQKSSLIRNHLLKASLYKQYILLVVLNNLCDERKGKGVYMALINCPECGKQISSTAPVCLNCGAPIANKESKTAIQMTSKKLKLQYAICCIVFLASIICFPIAVINESQIVGILSVIFLLLSVSGAVFTKIQIWWHHE